MRGPNTRVFFSLARYWRFAHPWQSPRSVPNPQVPKAERDQADQPLALSETEQADVIHTHFPFGTPACPEILPQATQG